MVDNTSKFPDEIWDGLSPTRPFKSLERPPDQEDFEQIVAEIRATQQYILDNPSVSGGGSFLLFGMTPNPIE